MRGEKRPWTILQQKTNTGWFLYWEPQSRLADITRDALKFRGLISNPTQPQNGAALPPQFEKRRLKPSPVERGTHAPSPRPRGGHSLLRSDPVGPRRLHTLAVRGEALARPSPRGAGLRETRWAGLGLSPADGRFTTLL